MPDEEQVRVEFTLKNIQQFKRQHAWKQLDGAGRPSAHKVKKQQQQQVIRVSEERIVLVGEQVHRVK
jgi:hypothetical protein